MPGRAQLAATHRSKLLQGGVIPAHPLALDAQRRLDERRQRALTRYYLAAGAGGVAVGVHTTQFGIHSPQCGLYRPVLELAAQVVRDHEKMAGEPVIGVAGIVGATRQAVKEASLAADLRYRLGLLSFTGMPEHSLRGLLDHARAVAEILPVMGFYLQPAVGGRDLPYEFWREFCQIEGVAAIKVAPFDRYRTLDVMRAVSDSGRASEIGLYTGNDDNIIGDLLTTYGPPDARVRFVGGLLGQWAVWTRMACRHWRLCRESALRSRPDSTSSLLRLNAELSDANAALFDARNRFAGCIAGIHEVLRRQGLLEGIWCLDESEGLSPGQLGEIDRVCGTYPHLTDDAFVREHLDSWLR